MEVNNRRNIQINDCINMKDNLSNGYNPAIIERMAAGPKKTHIKLVNRKTGEVLREGHNSIMLPGSQQAACKLFGLEQTVPVPTYNSLLKLDKTIGDDWSVQPYNDPIVCLWAAGRDGFDTAANEINATTNLDRIDANHLVPFRYVPSTEDLTQELRRVYFGRKSTDTYISYYFKAFDTTPLLHIRYLDGTEVTSNFYEVDTSQIVDIWVEMRLGATRNDFRDYFDLVLGWDNADISSIELLMAWYDNTIPEDPTASAADAVYYSWYQDIIPFSKWNFKSIDLTDLTEAVDFIYQVYF